jgi:hypothetical protein
LEKQAIMVGQIAAIPPAYIMGCCYLALVQAAGQPRLSPSQVEHNSTSLSYMYHFRYSKEQKSLSELHPIHISPSIDCPFYLNILYGYQEEPTLIG